MNNRSKVAGSTNLKIPIWIQQEEIRISHLLNFKIRIRQYTTTVCSYQQKPKVEQRKAKNVLTQNWTFFLPKFRRRAKKKKGPYKSWSVFLYPNSGEYQKVKKGLR